MGPAGREATLSLGLMSNTQGSPGPTRAEKAQVCWRGHSPVSLDAEWLLCCEPVELAGNQPLGLAGKVL